MQCQQIISVVHNPGETEEDETETVTSCSEDVYEIVDGKALCVKHSQHAKTKKAHHETYDSGWTEEYEIDG
jgi:hypothetical protein